MKSGAKRLYRRRVLSKCLWPVILNTVGLALSLHPHNFTQNAHLTPDLSQRGEGSTQKIYRLAQNGPVRWMITPSGIFYEYYKKRGRNDSALKYHEIYMAAQDSLYSIQKIQRVQALSIEEDFRQKEIVLEKERTKAERKQSIQYAVIAIGIIVLLVLFLLLSHSVIVNEQIIGYFNVIGLLILFEFINLVLHPYLSNLTHYSPVLMLLIMVCIAAILVPVHHRLEKWLRARLVEKNKRIRLKAAKKTIEVLEGNSTIR